MRNDGLGYKVAVVGLGYVGLPLAVAFAARYVVNGFDIDHQHIARLLSGHQNILPDYERVKEQLRDHHLQLSSDENAIAGANVYIVTVPTPVDNFNVPDLRPLRMASAIIGKYLQKGNIVVFESTVYPGCTEEVCIPILEQQSGLRLNEDFHVGYSPERINPGDPVHTLTSIQKIVSGSNKEALDKIAALYASIIDAGVYKTASIKVAEAAKVIENAQRDVNISFVNELALIFDRMGIDTTEVLEAASTKWNFLKFSPGLVGGHCISVDPYYLAYKSEQLGYLPQVILSGRRVNSSIGQFIANKVVKLLIQKEVKIKGAHVLILGFAFKENCPDFRNTKVWDICTELQDFGVNFTIADDWVNHGEVLKHYGIVIEPLADIAVSSYDAVILAVPHRQFLQMDFSTLKQNGTVIYDVKSVLDRQSVDARL